MDTTWKLILLLLATISTCKSLNLYCQRYCNNVTANLDDLLWRTKISVIKNEDGSVDIQVTPAQDSCKPCERTATASTTAPPRKYNVQFEGTDKQVLNLSGNNYTGLDVKMALDGLNIISLYNVRALYLSHNNITDLPAFTFPEVMEGVGNRLSSRLVELHLDHNRLQFTRQVRFELYRLRELQLLNLSRSHLSDAQSFTTLLLPRLRHLDLSHNQLSFMPNLLGLPELDILDLTGNQLLSPSADGLPNSLGSLLLSHNDLSYIYDLKTSWHLLDLSNNSLERIWDIEDLQVEQLRIGNNPFKCDCRLLEMVSKRGHTIQDKENFRCTHDGVEYLPTVGLPKLFTANCYIASTGFYKRSQEIGRVVKRTLEAAFVRLLSLLAWVFFVLGLVLVWAHRNQKVEINPKEQKDREASGHEVLTDKLEENRIS